MDMAATRKESDALDPATAEGKLSQLLDTETELDAMLQETNREAAALVESARAAADDRIRKLESELRAADLELREQIARERDEAIAQIRTDAQRERDELDALDDRVIDDLAAYVVARVVGCESGGRS